jgi:phosphatidate cytidylyltransferase
MKDFFIRLGSSITLVILTFATLFLGGYILAGVLFLVSLVGYRELVRACKLTDSVNKISSIEIIGFIAILIYYLVLVFVGDVAILFLMLNAALVVFMAFYVLAFPKYHTRQIMEAFFCVLYAPVMLSCIYLTRDLENGVYIVWLIFISSWICDSCAYCVGMLIGKHKLVPKLSPKKSVEGAVGGVIGAMAVGALYGHFFVQRLVPELEITVIFAVICGIGAVIAEVGDLAASAIKRHHDIKDFGKLIPGHGGIMDRFDSVIFTAPVIYLLAELII